MTLAFSEGLVDNKPYSPAGIDLLGLITFGAELLPVIICSSFFSSLTCFIIKF